MEIIKQGSDNVFEAGPLNCCFPAGTLSLRVD